MVVNILTKTTGDLRQEECVLEGVEFKSEEVDGEAPD